MTYRDREEGDKAIRLSGNKCIICGWCEKDYKGDTLLIRAHIRPYKKNSIYDIYNNIIALCPNHHTEFDKGNFTIDYDTNKIIHRDRTHEIHDRKIIGNINHVKKEYLLYHRNRIFKGK